MGEGSECEAKKTAPDANARGGEVVSERTAKNVLTEASPTRAASRTDRNLVAAATAGDETGETDERD